MEPEEYTLIDLPERYIIGIERRTCNADGRSLNDIPACWKEFLATRAAAKIPDKVKPTIMYAAYADYESDWTGEYAYLLGCGVNAGAKAPKGLVRRTIPAQHYAVFHAKGPMPNAVVGVWAGIWASDLPRTYQCDFEIYDARFTDKNNPQVDIYVGIKKETSE